MMMSCPSVRLPVPIPNTGILSALAIAQAGSAGIASNNNQQAPAS
jgi:hypothetical protein